MIYPYRLSGNSDCLEEEDLENYLFAAVRARQRLKRHEEDEHFRDLFWEPILDDEPV